MAYELIVGTEREIKDRINGAISIGPVPLLGAAVGGLTLVFNTPAATVTFTGSAGALRTSAQIKADIVAQASGVAVEVRDAGVGGPDNVPRRGLALTRDAGLDIDSAGTANAILGLSTTADTVSAGSADPSRIRQFSQGLVDGHYCLLMVDSVGAGAADPIIISDGDGPLTVDTAQLPATLGTKVAASSLSVVLASNQPAIPVIGIPAALGPLTAAASTSVVLASDDHLKGTIAAIASGSVAEAANDIPLGRHNLTPPVLTDGQLAPLQLDASGFLKNREQFQPGAEDNTPGINVIATARKPVNSATYCWSNAFNAQLATNVIVKASAGVVRRVQGYLDLAIGAGTFYVCVLNEVSAVNGTRALLRAPQKIVVPAVPVDMPFDLDFDDGVAASTGITIAVSTTGGNAAGTVNLTLATANMLVTSVRYV